MGQYCLARAEWKQNKEKEKKEAPKEISANNTVDCALLVNSFTLPRVPNLIPLSRRFFLPSPQSLAAAAAESPHFAIGWAQCVYRTAAVLSGGNPLDSIIRNDEQ